MQRGLGVLNFRRQCYHALPRNQLDRKTDTGVSCHMCDSRGNYPGKTNDSLASIMGLTTKSLCPHVRALSAMSCVRKRAKHCEIVEVAVLASSNKETFEPPGTVRYQYRLRRTRNILERTAAYNSKSTHLHNNLRTEQLLQQYAANQLLEIYEPYSINHLLI